MQFTIDKDVFQKAVAAVQGVIDRRGSMPILSHALLQTNGNGLEICGTDMEVSYKGHALAQVAEEGGITVSAAKLFALLKEMAPGEIEAHTTETYRLALKRGESKYSLHGLTPDQFPTIPTPSEEMTEIKSKVLEEMVGKVAHSMSADDEQYHLSGVLLEQGEGKPMRLVSTDGHRLALIDRQVGTVAGDRSIFIPRKGAMEAVRFPKGETVLIGFAHNTLFFKDGARELSIRLLDKKFPEYRRIIPENGFKNIFAFNRQALVEALRRLSVLSSERFKAVRFELGKETARLTFESPEEGEGTEVVPVLEHKAEDELLPFHVTFNTRYLLEPLQAMDGERVLLEINNTDHPCRLMDPEDRDYFSLVMPVSL